MDRSTGPEPKDPSDLPARPDPHFPDLKETQDRLALWVTPDQLAQQAQQVTPELLVPLGQQVLRVPPVPQETPAQSVQREALDPQAQLALLVLLVLLGQQVPQDPQAPRSSRRSSRRTLTDVLRGRSRLRSSPHQ